MKHTHAHAFVLALLLAVSVLAAPAAFAQAAATPAPSASPAGPKPLLTAQFDKVPPNFFGKAAPTDKDVREFFEHDGILFPDGAYVKYDQSKNLLSVRLSQDDIDVIKSMVAMWYNTSPK